MGGRAAQLGPGRTAGCGGSECSMRRAGCDAGRRMRGAGAGAGAGSGGGALGQVVGGRAAPPWPAQCGRVLPALLLL